MIKEILGTLFFFLPAFVANSLPVYAKRFNWFPAFAIPIDSKKKFKGKRILGDNKTYRGFLVAFLGSFFVGAIQYGIIQIFPRLKEITILEYSSLFFVLSLAVFQGVGSLIGDCLKSFLKRQLNISPGKPWIGPDQIDYIVGGIAFGLIFFIPTARQIIILFIFGVLLHFISNIYMKLLGIRKEWL